MHTPRNNTTRKGSKVLSTTTTDVALSEANNANGEVDYPLQGIVLIALGIGTFSLQDVIIRSIGDTYPGFEIMFIRGLVALGPIFLIVLYSGGVQTLKVRHFGLNVLRGLLGLISYTAYYMGLQALPLAETTAIFFISPLIVTMLSALILRETVGIRRWSAILAGFAGVLMIVQPTSGSISPVIGLPVLAACTYAFSIILTRRIGRYQSGASMAFCAMFVFVVFSGIAGLTVGQGQFDTTAHPAMDFLTRAWVVPTPLDAAVIAACGFIAAFGFYCLAQGYKVAPVSVVAPFEFVSMPLAVFWGFAIWAEVPNALVLLGITTVVFSGIYVLKREGLPGKKPLTTGRGVRFRL